MYKNYYKMKREAFVNQPLPDMFFSSKSHKEGWHYLAYGINSKEPFMLLCGDYGMGKTTLCLKLVQSLKETGRLPFIFLSTPIYSYNGLLTKIGISLDIPLDQSNESSTQESILGYFENNTISNGILIILDDAHEIDTTILKKVRMLASFNIDGYFPIRLLFFAHLSFIDKLKTNDLLPLNQRIKRRFYLDPLDFSETKEYIYFRMVRAGATGVPAFSETAIRRIFNYSNGVPRSINNICDACLLLGANRRLDVLDEFLVSRAIEYIEGSHLWLQPAPVATAEAGTAQSADRTARGMDEPELLPRTVLDEPFVEPPVVLRAGGAPAHGRPEPETAPKGSEPWDEDGGPSRVSLDFPLPDSREQHVQITPPTRGRFKLRDLIAVALLFFVLALALAFFVDLKSFSTMFNALFHE